MFNPFGTPTEFVNGETDPLASPSHKGGRRFGCSTWMIINGVLALAFIFFMWMWLAPKAQAAPALPTVAQLPPPNVKINQQANPTQLLLTLGAMPTEKQPTTTPTPTTTSTAGNNQTRLAQFSTGQATHAAITNTATIQAGGVTRVFILVTETATPRVVTATPTATDKVVQITNTPGATQTPYIIVQSPTPQATQTPWIVLNQASLTPIITVVSYQTVVFYHTQEVTRIVTATPAPPTATAASTTAPTATPLTPTATRTP
jgi:hypothetical protein